MPHSSAFHSRHGFTLIEISIVLLIIAMILGGIVGGQEMVNAARLQRIGKEAYEIRDAAMLFQSKYEALPGDITNATKLWGNSGCNNSINVNPCDGDGDGRVWFNQSILAYTAVNGHEELRFWQHMNLAQLFPGSYSGLFASPISFMPKTNMPAGPLDGTGYLVAWTVIFTTGCGANCWTRGQYSSINNMIRFEGAGNNPTGVSATNAKTIDLKLDDGIAYTGRFMAVSDWSDGQPHGCPAYDEVAAPPDYNTTIAKKDCGMRINVIDTQRGAT